MSNISIEVFCAPKCNRCGKTVSLVEEVIDELNNKRLKIKKSNVVEELDHAVRLGIRATPAIAINDKLEFTASPSRESLKVKIMEYL